MVAWAFSSRISILRNNFLCWSPRSDWSVIHVTSSLSVCCCPVKGNAGWLLLGEVIMSHWWPYVTQDHWSSLPSPYPLAVFTYVIVFTLVYVGTMCLQAILSVPNGKWNPSPSLGMTSNYVRHFYCTFPKACGNCGGRIENLPWWLLSLPSSSCFSHWVTGYTLFLSRYWESPTFFLAYPIDFVKTLIKLTRLDSLDIWRVLNTLLRVLCPQEPNQLPTDQTWLSFFSFCLLEYQFGDQNCAILLFLLKMMNMVD